MTQARYAVIELQGDITAVEATFDNRPHPKVAARKFCQEVAAYQDAELRKWLSMRTGSYSNIIDTLQKITEVKAYDEGQTL